MSSAALPREINFVKVGAVAAFLLAAALVAAITSLFFALSDVDVPRSETREFLDDVVDKKNFAIAVVWLFVFSALLIVPVALGLYYGLRRWGEDYMRVAVLAAVVAAIFSALASVPVAALTAYIVPAWGEAGDEATRAILLSDATTLFWASDAMTSMFFVAIAIAIIAAGLVMLRIGTLLWTGLGWIGIASGVTGIIGAFWLAAEALGLTFFPISLILAIIWLLGVGVGLLRRLPGEEAQPTY